MNLEELRALQAPLKDKYRQHPEQALITMRPVGELDFENVICKIPSKRCESIQAGLASETGGDGSRACSAAMLLEALMGCAGVTFIVVSKAMKLAMTSGTIEVEGVVDYRGTLGISRETPVGFQRIGVTFLLDTTASDAELQKAGELTERYCIVAQTLNIPVTISFKRN